MDRSFYIQNRQRLCEGLPVGSVAVVFAGEYVRKTADENHLFYANRNFVYLTGLEQMRSALMLAVTETGVAQTLFLLPKDPHWERWNGTLLDFGQAAERSGIIDVRPLAELDAALDARFARGTADTLWLDFDKLSRTEPDSPAYALAGVVRARFPHAGLKSLLPALKRLRAIKAECEIEAMEQAETLTGKGIAAMMGVARPGLFEYNLKAAFEGALMNHGALPGFPPIISTGANNFCIHYYGYHGQIAPGDMILCDVGARYDFLGTDVSRAWPAGGRFSDRQKLLYECAYQTSEHVFGQLRPGLPHSFVDKTIRQYNFERLRDAGVCQRFEEVGRYMWHGGAHHVGFDTHDVVDVVEQDRVLEPGMVFCVDIGIYHEEWGIGFRLEDNCLITPEGCRNLSAGIPRSVSEIEAALGR